MFGSLQRIPALVVFAVFLHPVDVAYADDVTFAEIDPILKQRCVMCHQGAVAPLGLRLDSLAAVLAGSERGAIVKAADAQNSELILRLKGTRVPRMPMTGPPYLTDVEVTKIEDWINAGMQAAAVRTKVTDSDANPVADTVTSIAMENEQAPLAALATAGMITFDEVAPILATRCAKCHTDNGMLGAAPEGYRLTSYDATISASDRVRIVPGNPAASELIRRIRGQARPRMPFDGPPFLDDAEIRLLERWVMDGARNSAGDIAPVPVGSRIRLHGKLVRRWQLDDLPLEVTSATRIDKNPQVGDTVRIRGHVKADGSIAVDRIVAR